MTGPNYQAAWEAFKRAYDEYQERNNGWRAFWTDHHAYAFNAGLVALGLGDEAIEHSCVPVAANALRELANEIRDCATVLEAADLAIERAREIEQHDGVDLAERGDQS